MLICYCWYLYHVTPRTSTAADDAAAASCLRVWIFCLDNFTHLLPTVATAAVAYDAVGVSHHYCCCLLSLTGFWPHQFASSVLIQYNSWLIAYVYLHVTQLSCFHYVIIIKLLLLPFVDHTLYLNISLRQQKFVLALMTRKLCWWRCYQDLRHTIYTITAFWVTTFSELSSI